MSNFNKCLEIVLHHEGGYVNHPKDPGGMTNMGVTKRVYEEWVGYSVSENTMQNLKEEDVAEVGINRAIELIQKHLDEKKEIIIGLHPETKKNIIQKKGIKGRSDYLSYNKKNYSISEDLDKSDITLEKALEIIKKSKKT